MRKALLGGSIALVFVIQAYLRWNSETLLLWQASERGKAILDLFRMMPYLALGLSAIWSARLSNAPVFALSLVLIPAQYYFSGGAVFVGGVDQMRFVLFLMLPMLVLGSAGVSHRTLACGPAAAFVFLLIGFVLPPLLSATFGKMVLTWVGTHRWSGAGLLGAPSSPTLYYLAVFGIHLILPIGRREGDMKKILAGLIPCFFFSGVFNPIFQSGPMVPHGLEPLNFVLFTSLAALLTLYANFSLSWSKAYVDDLTQVLGRRALNETFSHLNAPYSIAMVDIDHFKQFNDTYGHAAGDAVLREVAGHLSRIPGGRTYRYGGEEFSILFPNREVQDVFPLLDESRKTLSEMKISLNGHSGSKRPKPVTVQISAGVAACGKNGSTPEEVLRLADRALYKAKENGRNRVETG